MQNIDKLIEQIEARALDKSAEGGFADAQEVCRWLAALQIAQVIKDKSDA